MGKIPPVTPERCAALGIQLRCAMQITTGKTDSAVVKVEKRVIPTEPIAGVTVILLAVIRDPDLGDKQIFSRTDK